MANPGEQIVSDAIEEFKREIFRKKNGVITLKIGVQEDHIAYTRVHVEETVIYKKK